MRIIFLTCASNASGGARQAAYLAEELTRRNHDVVFFTPPHARLRERDFSVEWADLPENVRHLQSTLEARMKGAPCVVQAFHNKAVKMIALLGLIWRLQGAPVVCFGYRGVIFFPRNPLPYLSPGMEGFFANSEAAARTVRRISCGFAKTHVVYNAIPDKRLAPENRADDVRAELGLGETDLVFGTVTGNTKTKGMHILVPAFARALKGGHLPPCAKLLAVGAEAEKWLPLCHEHGVAAAVRLPGHRDCVADYLQCMDIFVLPSLSESLPNTLLEAMCMGLPVVATKVGGVPEILSAAEGGILVPPGDVNALAAALGVLGGNAALREQMREANARRRNEFSIVRRAEVFESIYRNALERCGISRLDG